MGPGGCMKGNCTEISKNANNVRTTLEAMEESIKERIVTLKRQLGL